MGIERLQLSRRSLLAGAAGFSITTIAVMKNGRASASPSDRISIAVASSNLITTLEQVLKKAGFLERFGLVADTIFVVDGSKLLGAIISGDVDYCPLSGYASIFPAIARGADLKLINASIRLGQQAIFSGNPAIKTIKDLQGKTVGVGSLDAQLYEVTLALLLKNGVDPKTVTFADIGSSSNVFSAVAAKVIDAGLGQVDNIPMEKKLGVHVVQGGEAWVDLKEFPFQGGYASTKVIAEKRDVFIRTLAAYATLFRYISGPTSHDAFLAARQEALGKSGPAFDGSSEFQWQFMQKTQPFALDLILPPQGVDYVQDLNIKLGLQTARLPYEQVADMSMAQAAIKLL